MTYKYQNEIEDAVDVMVKVMGRDKHSKAQQELAEVYRKAEAFNKAKKEIRKNASYLFTKTPSEERNAQIDILNGILIAMDDAEFDVESEEGSQ